MYTEKIVPSANVTLSSSKGAPASVTLSLSKGDPDVTLSSSKGASEAIAAAVLFRAILKPLANGLGPIGEIAAGSVADALFLRNRR